LEAGSLRWMAPELLFPEKSGSGRYLPIPTLESDMWALAMLILEIFTDAEPYKDEPDHIIVTYIVEKKRLPARPDPHISERGLTDAVWGLMRECWSYKPVDRPKINYMIRNLHRLSQDIRPSAWEERTVSVTMFRYVIDTNNSRTAGN
jgi:hypothetical protein